MCYKLEVGMACPLNKIPSSTGEEIIQYSHLSEERQSVCVCKRERVRKRDTERDRCRKGERERGRESERKRTGDREGERERNHYSRGDIYGYC